MGDGWWMVVRRSKYIEQQVVWIVLVLSQSGRGPQRLIVQHCYNSSTVELQHSTVKYRSYTTLSLSAAFPAHNLASRAPSQRPEGRAGLVGPGKLLAGAAFVCFVALLCCSPSRRGVVSAVLHPPSFISRQKRYTCFCYSAVSPRIDLYI